MPELPEVETVRRDLDRRLKNSRVKKIEVRLPKIVLSNVKVLQTKLRGARVITIERRAKLVVIRFSNKVNLHIHLKMTGQLVLKHNKKIIFGGHTIVNATTLPNKYTHVIIYFVNGDILYFNDLRKFGYVRLYNQEASRLLLSQYGLEPLEKDFTFFKFSEIISKRPKAKLKQVLLDQKLIAGLGNIYADEVCFCAKVRPFRLIASLSLSERKKLWLAIRSVLTLSLKHGGTTFSTYVNSDGRSGNFWRYLKVYGRAGKPCRTCKTAIKRVIMAGRGTVYCPRCQK